ncbi:hypothetical protein [Roseisolibacter sp. H3M3-2]|uniref:hypothetical protein n=1 Tax=Roseisolibacter sp. H3M3-2 TaxID=3031323 RepID=UPI0023DB95AC|nr:hypothetical protein [Roseisolibacter sp. H3M3-2]MDF1505231.1 hypothetical protein [Roseisolibacter sp. H3M3-2]
MLRSLLGASAALILAAAPAAAQQHDHGAEQHAAGGWKEMDAFHQVMMATWHPAAGKNDLAPARAKAGELAAAARAWKGAAVPKACDTPATRAAVAKVAAGADAFAALAAKAGTTDAALKAALKGVHDDFEPVEEGCAPAGAVKKDGHAGHAGHP